MVESCIFLNPQQPTITGMKPSHHQCELKELIGSSEYRSCFASRYYGEHGDNFVSYDPSIAKNCPLFTTDEGLAKKIREFCKDLRK